MSERIDDGHSTRISFANYPSVKLYEKEVTPPGIQGGGENDTTTMLNSVWRTKSPKQLKTLSEASGVFAYDPTCYNDLVSMINENQLMTVDFPDGTSLTFWGWVDDFQPQRLVEGTQPTAEVKIIPSNQNASKVETAPLIT